MMTARLITAKSEAASLHALTQIAHHCCHVLMADWPMLGMQVTAVFARRGYNVQSLAVGPCETPGCSRIIMVVPGTPSGIANLEKQLLKLIYVQKVWCRQQAAVEKRCLLSLGCLRTLPLWFDAKLCHACNPACAYLQRVEIRANIMCGEDYMPNTYITC